MMSLPLSTNRRLSWAILAISALSSINMGAMQDTPPQDIPTTQQSTASSPASTALISWIDQKQFIRNMYDPNMAQLDITSDILFHLLEQYINEALTIVEQKRNEDPESSDLDYLIGYIIGHTKQKTREFQSFATGRKEFLSCYYCCIKEISTQLTKMGRLTQGKSSPQLVYEYMMMKALEHIPAYLPATLTWYESTALAFLQGDINALTARAYSGDTLLMNASMNGHSHLIKTILNAVKENPEHLQTIFTERDNNFCVALMLASAFGHEGVVTAILNATRNNPKLLPKLLPQEAYSLALMLAIDKGHEDVVTAILNTARNNPKLLQTILTQHGNYGRTPLLLAIDQGNQGIVTALLNATDGNPELIQLILTQQDVAGLTPLVLASRSDKVNIVTALLNATPDNPELLQLILTQQDNAGSTPLMLAIDKGNEGIVTAILNAALNNQKILKKILSQECSHGYTPLTRTSQENHVNIATTILNAVKDDSKLLQRILTQKANYGRTPLMLASRFGHVDVVTLLLNAAHNNPSLLQIILTQKCSHGSTARHYALENDNTAIIALLDSTLAGLQPANDTTTAPSLAPEEAHN